MSQEAALTEAEKKEAREKLKERFGESTRTGGKGTLPYIDPPKVLKEERRRL